MVRLAWGQMADKGQKGERSTHPTKDYTEPIELRPFFIEGGLGKMLKDLIVPMLEDEPAKRPTAEKLVGPWQDLFLEAAKRAYALDGRVV